MADYTVTSVFDLIAHQHVTNPNSVYGAARTATDMLAVRISIHHGFIETGANTDPGSFYIQTRLEDVDDQWETVAKIKMTNATVVDEALDAIEGSTVKSIAVTLTAGFAEGDEVYITDATADTDDEWHKIDVIVADTSIELIDGLVNGKEVDDVIYSDAEHFPYLLDLTGVAQYRVIYKNEGGTALNSAIWVRGIEVTDFA